MYAGSGAGRQQHNMSGVRGRDDGPGTLGQAVRTTAVRTTAVRTTAVRTAAVRTDNGRIRKSPVQTRRSPWPIYQGLSWWSSGASIPGPHAFQACALPTELLDRVGCRGATPGMCTRPPFGGPAAVPTGLEPATSGLTGRRELQTSPRDLEICVPTSTPNGIRTRAATLKGWCPRPLDDGGRKPHLVESVQKPSSTRRCIPPTPPRVRPPRYGDGSMAISGGRSGCSRLRRSATCSARFPPPTSSPASVSGGQVDLREAGSGNPGGANAAKVLGARAGAMVIGGDIAKGAAAVGARCRRSRARSVPTSPARPR